MHHIKLVSRVFRFWDAWQTIPLLMYCFGACWGNLNPKSPVKWVILNMPAQILKVKIKDAVSKLALQTKQARGSPGGCGANFIRSPWLLPPNSLSFKKNNNNNNNENAFLSGWLWDKQIQCLLRVCFARHLNPVQVKNENISLWNLPTPRSPNHT